MDLETSQSELRHAYVHGGPGAIISGLVWLAAGITAVGSGVSTGFAVLFLGGMLIFPSAKLFIQGVYRRKSESKENPGGLIVIETIFPMIGGLFAAWLIMPYRPEFVFPIAAIAVGAHYFGFRTAYGDWTYWVFGTTLCSVGTASIIFGFPPSSMVPFAFAFIEIVFGCWFVWRDRAQQTPATSDPS